MLADEQTTEVKSCKTERERERVREPIELHGIVYVAPNSVTVCARHSVLRVREA